ncbi:MAG TPA: phage/plasmid primase, P4 family [Gemmataceae bacterium]|nr:phage/plasmid primase, P4 family [Gemmataceae bacterium]
MTRHREKTLAERIAERDQATRKGNQKARKTKPAPAPSRNGRAPQPGDIHATDLGNAKRVVKRHGADLHYVHPWKTWLIWDGKRWAEDATGEAVRRVKDTIADIYRGVADQVKQLGDAEEASAKKARLDDLVKHALKWEDARAITRSLELARSEPGVPILPADLDRDPMLLNVLNGTVNLRTGQLRPHQREDLITKLAPVQYDEAATCPRWLKFLDRITDGNTDLISYLQRVMGYALTGDVSEQCLWFFYGTGANGKSTFLGTILAMLGDYAMQAVSDLLLVKHNESHPTERADLFGKRLVGTIETEEGKWIAEALMKQMTGGDKIRARKMRQDFFEFDPTFKIILAANHKPTIRGTDHAAWRRVKLVPFTVTIPDEEKDKGLPAKLKAESSGVLAWAVAGCLDWQRYGLGEPDEVRQATSQYQAEQDVVQGFIDECCQLYPEAKANSSGLLAAYIAWSGDKLMTAPAFRKRMKDKGFESKEGTGGRYFWRGLQLKQATEEGGDSGGEWR